MPSTTHRRTELANLVPFSVAIWCAVLMTSSTVTAQVATPLIPPVATCSTDVPYPFNASGDALVLIELVVEKDGRVASAQVLEGAEPFAEQARTAVLGWRFTPARRGDSPVAVRIHARIEFHQDKAVDASAPDSVSEAGTTAPSRAPAPAGALPAGGAPQSPTPTGPPATTIVQEAPIDVTVRGTRHEIGQTTLSSVDVREMPGAFGDPFRAIGAITGRRAHA